MKLDSSRLITEVLPEFCDLCAKFWHESVQKMIKDMPEIVLFHDRLGITPVMFVAQYGHYQSAQTLLAHGADITEFSNEGFSAVHYAACRWDPGIISLFIHHGISPDFLDRDGNPPIVHAVGANQEVTVWSLCHLAKCQIDNICVGGIPQMNLLAFAAYCHEMAIATPREKGAAVIYEFLEKLLRKPDRKAEAKGACR